MDVDKTEDCGVTQRLLPKSGIGFLNVEKVVTSIK